MTQVCSRETCQGMVREGDPRMVIDGKVYHYYCGWKVKEKQKEDHNAYLLQQASGSDNPLLPK